MTRSGSARITLVPDERLTTMNRPSPSGEAGSARSTPVRRRAAPARPAAAARRARRRRRPRRRARARRPRRTASAPRCAGASRRHRARRERSRHRYAAARARRPWRRPPRSPSDPTGTTAWSDASAGAGRSARRRAAGRSPPNTCFAMRLVSALAPSRESRPRTEARRRRVTASTPASVHHSTPWSAKLVSCDQKRSTFGWVCRRFTARAGRGIRSPDPLRKDPGAPHRDANAREGHAASVGARPCPCQAVALHRRSRYGRACVRAGRAPSRG